MKMYREVLSWRTGSMEVAMRNGEMDVKYVKDGEVGWTPDVRRWRKKSTRSEENESSGNLNMNNKRRSMVRYRKVDGIPVIYIRENESFEMGDSVASRTRTKINIK